MAKREPSLRQVIEAIQESADKNLEAASANLDLINMDKQIAALQKNYFAQDSGNADRIREQYERLVDIYENNTGIVKEQAREQIEALKQNVTTEEEAAEKKKEAADQTNALLRMADGIESFEKTLDGAFSGAGKAAFGIGALALLFKPEVFVSGVLKIIEFVRGGIDAINAIIEGDWGKAFDFISENFLAVAGVLTFFAVKFGVISAIATGFRKAVDLWRWATMSLQSGLLRSAIDFGKRALVGGWNLITKAWTLAQLALKSNLMQQAVALMKTAAGAAARGVMTAIAMLGPALAAVGTFMTGTALPAIGAALMAAGAAIAPILVAAAPFIAIGAGIVAAFFALKEQFTRILDIWDSSDSILEALYKIAIDIITAPIRWGKNLLAWVMEAFGFDGIAQALSDFSITDFIYDSLMSLGNAVMDWATSIVPDWLLDWLGVETKPEKPEPKEADVPKTKVYESGESDLMDFDSGVSAKESFDKPTIEPDAVMAKEHQETTSMLDSLLAKYDELMKSDAPEEERKEYVTKIEEQKVAKTEVEKKYVAEKFGIDPDGGHANVMAFDWMQDFFKDEPTPVERNTSAPIDVAMKQAELDLSSFDFDSGATAQQMFERSTGQEAKKDVVTVAPAPVEQTTSLIEKTLGINADDFSSIFSGPLDTMMDAVQSIELPSLDEVGSKVTGFADSFGLEMPNVEIPTSINDALNTFGFDSISMPDIEMPTLEDLGIDKVTDVVDQLIDKVSAISPIRDTQVENNELRDIKESNTNLVIQQNAIGKGGGGGNATVSSQQVNVTNNVDIDRHAKMFTYSIAP